MKRLLLLVALLLLLPACGEEAAIAPEPVKAVKTITISESSKANGRQLSGTVKSANESTLSFRVGGRVATMEADIGDKVIVGQTLAALEQKEYKLAVKTAQARLASARSEFAEKSDALKRLNTLREKDFVAQSDVDQAQAAYSDAKSKVDVAITDLQNAQDDLSNTALKAPFEGSIASRTVDVFTEVGAGETIFTLQSESALVVEVFIPETLIRDVNYGDAVSVTFPALKGVVVAGSVSEIGAKAQSGNAFPVEVELANTTADIRSGMTAQTTFNFGEAKDTAVYLIPISAIDVRGFLEKEERAQGKGGVYVVEDGVVTKRLVTIRDVRGNELEVVEGLQSGDVLIVAGVPFLTEGEKVKKWNPTYNAPATLEQ